MLKVCCPCVLLPRRDPLAPCLGVAPAFMEAKGTAFEIKPRVCFRRKEAGPIVVLRKRRAARSPEIYVIHDRMLRCTHNV